MNDVSDTESYIHCRQRQRPRAMAVLCLSTETLRDKTLKKVLYSVSVKGRIREWADLSNCFLTFPSKVEMAYRTEMATVADEGTAQRRYRLRIEKLHKTNPRGVDFDLFSLRGAICGILPS